MSQERMQILNWLKEPPFDNPDDLKKKPDFSYLDWFERGRNIPRVIMLLRELLVDETTKKTPDLSIRIIYAIGWLGDKSSTNELMTVLESPDANIRSETIASLGRLKVMDAFDKISRFLDDKNEDVNVRANACIAIGQLAHPNSKILLQKTIKDSDSFVANAAQEGLRLLSET